jgi:hypothetical protein
VISRIWRGWTPSANADTYEQLLRTDIFPGILARQVPGFRGIQLLRRPLGDTVEFVTEMWFDSLDAVRAFAGEDYETAVVPPRARAVLGASMPARRTTSSARPSACGSASIQQRRPNPCLQLTKRRPSPALCERYLEGDLPLEAVLAPMFAAWRDGLVAWDLGHVPPQQRARAWLEQSNRSLLCLIILVRMYTRSHCW